MTSSRAGEIPIDGPCDDPVTSLAELGGLFSPGRRALTAGLVMTITLVAFEALAVSTVMPLVARELGSLELYGWVFSAFFLGDLIGIVVVGGLIDRGGLVRPLAAGLILFSIGLIIGGLAPSMAVLVAGRFLQGLGAGAIPPIAYVSIGRALPDDLRPRMFATLSTAWVLPGIIGPAIAGGVAQLTTWRAVFLGLLPLIALAGAITLPAIRSAVPIGDAALGDAALREGKPGGSSNEPSGLAMRRRLPIALVLAAGAGLLVAGLTSGTLIPGGPLAIVGFVLVVPSFMRLTPAGTLRAIRGLPAAVLLRGLLTFAFFCADAYVPLALQEWRGLGPAVAGIALTGATLSWTAGAWIQARRIDRWGVRRLVGSGFAIVVVGIVGFAAGAVAGRAGGRRAGRLVDRRSGHGPGLLAAVVVRPSRGDAGRRGDGHLGPPAQRRPRDGARDRGRWSAPRVRRQVRSRDLGRVGRRVRGGCGGRSPRHRPGRSAGRPAPRQRDVREWVPAGVDWRLPSWPP